MSEDLKLHFFTIGDKVAVYHGEARFIGFVAGFSKYNPNSLKIDIDFEASGIEAKRVCNLPYYFHSKQCRRLFR